MHILNDQRLRQQIDRQDFAGLIEEFPRQLEEALTIAESARLPRLNPALISNLVVAGLGGSAIAADLVKSYLNYRLKVPFQIVRHYLTPSFVTSKTLFICSSYSGNTEETLSAYAEAKRAQARIISLTSGGKLADLSRKNKIPLIQIPSGYPPRAALGYSFVSLLILLSRLGLVKDQKREIKRTIRLLDRYKVNFLPMVPKSNNPAKKLAEKLHHKVPLIYAGEDYFSPVALRWKQQICENAKVLSFCNVFPEFNHNELVGWDKIEHLQSKLAVVILKDENDHEQVKLRMKLIAKMFKEKKVELVELSGSGNTVMERMFSLIHFGDWTSYYLAILNRVNPTPVEIIERLKKSLART
ncbi:MAG: bifunctional phosphoglucose/phosphomannose isomerase [candidate division Zixibacteria bacterium]|nr:bifunctional phosphoglucose/phosphomannose isomerase [candidate division Zixibacteria bacterium]